MQGFILLCALASCFSYEGSVENKHYFQFSTPNADYGFIVTNNEPYLYCDTIFYRR